MSRDGFESSSKRRLSLRGGAGSPEKKPRNDNEMSKDTDRERFPNPERLSDYVEARTAQYANNTMDIDSTTNRIPTSATSSRFPQSISAQSSPPGSPDDRQNRRPLSRERHSAPLSTQPHTMASQWASSAPNEPEHMAYSSSSSRSSNRPQLPPQFSTSAPSQIPSPPSFNLSNGQPLVNPPLKTQAAFVGKLYAMLEDEDIARTGLIQWSPDGSVFTCPNPTEFANVTPLLQAQQLAKLRAATQHVFVNDLFATSTDPQAWEFRHHLFRRGEPHLLAQIKRKSARPNNAESSGLATSPTDDPNDRIAGWMRPDKPYSVPSPPKERVFGYNLQTGETVLPRGGEGLRPTSRGYWDSRQHGPPASSHGGESSYSRLHPGPSRPTGGAERYGNSSHYSEPAYHPSASGSSMEVSHRVAVLEEQIQRLTATLNEERVDNARNHLHATSGMMQILNWVSRSHHPSDIRAMRDSLNHQIYDSQQHYETLMASDVLANLSVPRPGSRLEERPRMSERTLSAQHRDRPSGFPDVRQPSRGGPATSPRPTYSAPEPGRPLSLAQLNEGIAQHPLTSSASYSTSPFDHASQSRRELHRRQTDGATQPVDTAADRDRDRDKEKDKDEPMEEARAPSGLRNLLN